MALNHVTLVRIQARQQGTILRLASPEAKVEFAAGGYSIVPAPRTTMKFYYVYILHNKNKNFIYIGYSEDVKQRVEEHNAGRSKSTKPYLPLELIHHEAYRNKKDAKRREQYLKTNRGRTTLMTMLKEYFAEN